MRSVDLTDSTDSQTKTADYYRVKWVTLSMLHKLTRLPQLDQVWTMIIICIGSLVVQATHISRVVQAAGLMPEAVKYIA